MKRFIMGLVVAIAATTAAAEEKPRYSVPDFIGVFGTDVPMSNAFDWFLDSRSVMNYRGMAIGKLYMRSQKDGKMSRAYLVEVTLNACEKNKGSINITIDDGARGYEANWNVDKNNRTIEALALMTCLLATDPDKSGAYSTFAEFVPQRMYIYGDTAFESRWQNEDDAGTVVSMQIYLYDFRINGGAFSTPSTLKVDTRICETGGIFNFIDGNNTEEGQYVKDQETNNLQRIVRTVCDNK